MKNFMRVATVCLAGAAMLSAAASARAGLVAYYPFEGNVNDASPNAFNGTVNGAAQYAPGAAGQAFSFNGGTGVATRTADELSLVNHSFTVAAYVSFADPGAGDRAVFGTNAGNASTSNEMHLIERAQKPLMGFYSNDTGGNTIFQPNQFYHVAWVYDSVAQTQSIYVNGDLDVTQGGRGAFVGTGRVASIGSSCCAGNMNGLIDEVRIYDTALNEAQVEALLVPEPSTAGLICVVGMVGAGLRRRRRGA